MKIQVMTVLLLALSATEISEAQDFFQKHVVAQMAPGDCNQKLVNINKNGECKDINTFFLDPNNQLTGICSPANKGVVNNKVAYTINLNNPLTIIDCKRDNNSPVYSVSVLCDNNGPKHLESPRLEGGKKH
uniref:Ribonuclease A-domain domain-containing protein n=1 Tax=Fundulus heteroclitus TaxID=8078 RepID=A0A3Q2P941_FUNHE